MTSTLSQLPCPLCLSCDCCKYHSDRTRRYYQCRVCSLVFVPSEFYLTAEQESAHYDLHENDPTDDRYRKFLSRLFDPVAARLSPNSSGLDFGSGPGPTLSLMFAEAGHRCAIYDCFYAPEEGVLSAQYDFVTASEVVEHLHRPGEVLDQLWACVRPGGVLGIMTKIVRNQSAFTTWHYILDPTHVCFYSASTFDWLAKRWGAELTREADDVVIFEKRVS